ncbi:hypothetical protein KI387_037887, partial [Taxus chinensis]
MEVDFGKEYGTYEAHLINENVMNMLQGLLKREEEDTQDYRLGGYHSIHIGYIFKQGHYTVQSKLGWGSFSTVWLVRDTHLDKYIALK